MSSSTVQFSKTSLRLGLLPPRDKIYLTMSQAFCQLLFSSLAAFPAASSFLLPPLRSRAGNSYTTTFYEHCQIEFCCYVSFYVASGCVNASQPTALLYITTSILFCQIAKMHIRRHVETFFIKLANDTRKHFC